MLPWAPPTVALCKVGVQWCWQKSDKQYKHASFHIFHYYERFTGCNIQIIRKYAVFVIVSTIQLIDSPRVTSLIHTELIFFTNLWFQLTNEYRYLWHQYFLSNTKERNSSFMLISDTIMRQWTYVRRSLVHCRISKSSLNSIIVLNTLRLPFQRLWSSLSYKHDTFEN